jgi:hypothetical protein
METDMENDVQKILNQLAALAEEGGEVKNLKVDMHRKVQFDIRGVPLKEQTAPIDVKLSFRYGGK